MQFDDKISTEEFHILAGNLHIFVDQHCIPAEAQAAAHGQSLKDLKEVAKKLGLWNSWIHTTNLQYAALCEIMGSSTIAPEACNCSAPGNLHH